MLICQCWSQNLIANLSTIKNFLEQVKYEVTDFYDKGSPKVDCNHTCLTVINLDSALERDKDNYAEVFLKV